MPSRVPFLALLLFATGGAGVGVHAEQPAESLTQFQHVSFAKLGGAPGDISRLALDDDGFLWMRAGRGSARFDGKAFRTFQTVPGILEPRPATDADGNTWWVAHGDLWVKPRGQGVAASIALAHEGVREAALGSGDRLFTRNDDGVHMFRRHGTRLVPVAKPILDTQVNGLLVSRSGALWVTRTTGVLHASREALDVAEREGHAPVMEAFNRANGLTGAFPQPLLEDTAGDIWVGTEGGLDLFRRTPFVPVALPEGLHQVEAATTARGTTWVGSDNMALLRIDADGTRTTHGPPSRVFAMALDTARDVAWAVNEHGVWRLGEGEPSLAAPLPHGGSTNDASFVAIPGAGHIVAAEASATGGRSPAVSLWNGTQWMPLPALPAVPVTGAAGSGGVLWLGLSGKPMLARIAEGKLATEGEAQGLATGPIKAIVADHGGAWVGGDRGVQFYDGTRFRTVHTEQPDLLHWVTGLALDRDGFLWVATSALVFRSRMPASRMNLDDPATPIRFDRFDSVDGIAGGADPDRGLPSLRVSADGRIWAKTVAGLSWIDPAHGPEPRAPATPRIEGVDVGGRHRSMDSAGIALGPDERDLAVRFTVAELSRPDRIRFQYRLLPSAPSWTDAGEGRQVSFTQFPAGRSTFEVRAMLGPQVSANPAVLAIHRTAAFRETAGFTALWVGALAGLLVLVLWLRMRAVSLRLRVRSEERDALARDIHDTLLQRFQGAMLTMQALARRPTLPDEERREIADVAEEARQVIVAGRDRIQTLRGAPDAGVGLYDSLLAEGQRLATLHGPAFTLTLDGKPVPLRENAAASLLVIATEVMTNAFRHAQGSRVDVTVSYETNDLWLVVTDDGLGFDPNAVERASTTGHFGLRGIRERVASLRGSIRIETAPGEGTEIHVRIPRRTAYR